LSVSFLVLQILLASAYWPHYSHIQASLISLEKSVATAIPKMLHHETGQNRSNEKWVGLTKTKLSITSVEYVKPLSGVR